MADSEPGVNAGPNTASRQRGINAPHDIGSQRLSRNGDRHPTRCMGLRPGTLRPGASPPFRTATPCDCGRACRSAGRSKSSRASPGCSRQSADRPQRLARRPAFFRHRLLTRYRVVMYTMPLGCCKNRWNPRPCSAEPAGRFYSAQKYGKLSGPKAQPFIQRRAKPWYIGRTASYILQCLAVFGPTGQEFA